MGKVHYPTVEELEAQRADIISRVGRSESDLRHEAEFGVLSGEEFRALAELDAIAFLLGENEVVHS